MSDATNRPDRTWLFVGLGFAIFLVVYVGYAMVRFSTLAPPMLARDAEPKRVDYGWTFSDLDGKPVAFERFRGKVVFLNVWATWCGPCIAELPSIARLAAEPRLKDKDVAFVCVSVDDAIEAPRDFARGQKWPMTVLHAASLPPLLTTDGIPATFVIDRDGRVVSRDVGAAAWDDPSVVAFLEELATATARPSR